MLEMLKTPKTRKCTGIWLDIYLKHTSVTLSHPEFLKWTLSLLDLIAYFYFVVNRIPVKNIEQNSTNIVDPDETAPDEPSHLVLHYLRKYLVLGIWG